MSANTPPITTAMTKVTAVQPMANAIVDMEKEQEGIVLKLLHEITALKEENKLLRAMVSTSTSPSVSVSSSSSMPSPTLNEFALLQSNTTGSSPNATLSNASPFLSQRRSTITTPTNLKRVPTTLTPVGLTPNPSQQSISRSSSLSHPRSRSNSVTSIGLSRSGFLDPDYVIRPSSATKKSHKRSSSDTCPTDITVNSISPAHSSRLSATNSKCPKISEGLMISQSK